MKGATKKRQKHKKSSRNIKNSDAPTLEHATDDMGIKQVRTEVPVDGQIIRKYSLVGCTVDSAAARKSLFYH